MLKFLQKVSTYFSSGIKYGVQCYIMLYFILTQKKTRVGKILLMLLSCSPIEDSEVELFKVTLNLEHKS